MSTSWLMADLIDGVIAFTVVECLALVAYHRLTGRGIAPREFVANMASGLCLMLALRSLAGDAVEAWTLLALLAAGAAHGTDLWLRWRRKTRAAAASPETLTNRRVLT